MYYPRFTKVIIDYFMAKDQAIPRRNKMFWHYARDDFMFTTIRVISKHQDTQVYGAILPQHLTNQAMLESEAYMTYHAYATGKRIKTVAKGDKPAKKKQYVTKSKGLTVLSEVPLTEAEQIKLATKRSLVQTHSSHASGSGADEGTGSEQTDSDNDGGDFVHPKLSTHDDEARQNDEWNEEYKVRILREDELDEEAKHVEDEAE
ncbi:hypothetical protein Tco_0839578 [Tanacetum coccineum]|uniref:Uncharacterized protein n=1 Tax=Tanacetum coccineum TaxID=301880 RepID=A0ABQ5AVN2_9ASTR